MSSRQWRYAIAFVIGALFDAVFCWKFRPYGIRDRMDLLPWYWLPILAFLAGLLLTFSMDGKKRWIPLAIVGGCFFANACLIAVDCAADPTNHNLWPFEFFFLGIALVPAFLGAGISEFVARIRSSRS